LATVRPPVEPEAAISWIHEAAHEILTRLLTEEMKDPSVGPMALLDALARSVAADLKSKNKSAQARAQNVFRLAMVFLLDRRGLPPWQALKVMRTALRGRGTVDAAPNTKEMRDTLVLAKPATWRLLAAATALADTLVRTAEEARADALAKQTELEQRINDLLAQNRAFAERLRETEAEIIHVKARIAASEKACETEQHRRALENAELKGRARGFLEGRVLPLIADAVDALEIAPPAPEVAIERLGSARTLIGGEVTWLGNRSE
jgi:hypothetical protein